jgi:hypothetical protein
MKVALLAVALLLTACGRGSSGASPSPQAATYTPIATPMSASPARLPGSVVRLSVNGTDYPVSSDILHTGDGPVTIVLTFPFAVDRQSVESWGLPPGTKTWLDDRTLRLVVPETEPAVNFKIAETRAARGDAIIDFFVVGVRFPAARTVNVFTVAELAAAGTRFPQTSNSWRIRSNDALTLSPEARRLLIFDGFGPPSGQVPTFVELDTKKGTQLPQPLASDGWFSFAEWMADGRLVMVGRGVWVGDANASNMTRIADTQPAVGGYVWVAVPDPAEKRLALWGYNSDGHIAVIDLTTGAVQTLAGPFRRCAADGAASFAWSADGRLLAGTDCDAEEGHRKARVRIVDVAADRTVRTIEGGAYGINALPTGNFVLVRDSGEVGQAARLLGLVMGFDGQERGRYLGHAWQMSPDRRYLLQTRFQAAGGPTYTLLDQVSGTSFEFGVPCGGRSDGGCPSPHWMRDGRLAFY